MVHKNVKTTYIHIGVDKTGSTSIQSFFDKYRDELKLHGIGYPPGRWQAQLGSVFSNKPEEYVFNVQSRFANIDDINIRDDRYISEIKEWIDTQDELDSIFLSYEGFISLKKDAFSAFKNFTDEFSENTKIILYVRKPISYFVSALGQRAKTGRSIDILVYHQYKNKISDLIDLFGKENIIVRLYDRKNLYNSDIVEDIFYSMDYETIYDNIAKEDSFDKIESNKSLSMEGLIFANLFREDLRNEPLTKNLANELTEGTYHDVFGIEFTELGDSKMVPEKHQAKEILELTKEDREFLKMEFDIDMDEDIDLDTLDTFKPNQLLYDFAKVMPKVLNNVLQLKQPKTSNDPDINMIRDIAVELEKYDINLSYKLMKIAHNLRPNGSYILNKLKKYEELINENIE